MADKIRDYATGKELNLTSEEIVRQDFEHILIDELEYPKSHIDIEFSIQRGSRRRAEKADIIVFKNDWHDQKNAYIIVETESPGNRLDNQVFSYATATTAEFVVWFDGLDRKKSQGAKYYWRDMATDPAKFVDIPAIPRYGETLEEIGQYKKSQLRPTLSLKGLFSKMHNRLYGEGPLKREDAIAQEVIKLLFCKIYDELYTPGDTCEFRATVNELRTEKCCEQVALRVKKLFKALKSHPEYADMFAGEELQYDSFWISYIVSELQGLGLLHPNTDTDAMGDAYEIFIGPQLKGESGQFFTPRAVVRLAVGMLRPSLVKHEHVIDPACGSGGFLIYTLRHVREEARQAYKNATPEHIDNLVRDYARNFMVGIDAEPLLYKVSKSYMAIVGNGRSGIFREDSLLSPDRWRAETQSRIQLDKFDVLLTNPPFGTKIKVRLLETLRQFDLGHRLKESKRTDEILASGQDPAILFLERAWQLLRVPEGDKSGGRMAIVLPRQITSGHHPEMLEIRKWILHHMRILAVVDLPRETFQPYCGTLTSLLFGERVASPVTDDYAIFMAVAEAVGHDRRGNPIYRRTPEGEIVYDDDNNPVIENDLPAISVAHDNFLKAEDFNFVKPSIFSVQLSEILKHPRQRIDAWFYDPNKNDIVKQIIDLEDTVEETIRVKTIDEVAKEVFYPGRHRRNYVEPGPDAVPFLSGTNILQIRSFDVKWQPRAYPPVPSCLVEKDWILVTRSGSTGRVLYVGDDIAGFPVDKGVAVSEHVIRIVPDPEEIDPGYLFAYLSSEKFGKILLDQGICASVVEHITPDHIKAIPIPVPHPDVQKAIGDKVREAEKRRAYANLTIKTVQDALEQGITAKNFGLNDIAIWKKR